MDEYIDIFDEGGNPLGIRKLKSEAHEKGLWHEAVHIWMYNPKGEILLQLRARNKEIHPGLWDAAAAGHIGAGETPAATAIREIKEEIGLDIKEESLEFYKKIKCRGIKKGDIQNNEFIYIYFLEYNGKIENLKLQEEEVGDVKFFPTEILEKDLRKNPKKYAPHRKYWFEVINLIKKKSKDIKN